MISSMDRQTGDVQSPSLNALPQQPTARKMLITSFFNRKSGHLIGIRQCHLINRKGTYRHAKQEHSWLIHTRGV
jgi:hypothetical protein